MLNYWIIISDAFMCSSADIGWAHCNYFMYCWVAKSIIEDQLMS